MDHHPSTQTDTSPKIRIHHRWIQTQANASTLTAQSTSNSHFNPSNSKSITPKNSNSLTNPTQAQNHNHFSLSSDSAAPSNPLCGPLSSSSLHQPPAFKHPLSLASLITPAHKPIQLPSLKIHHSLPASPSSPLFDFDVTLKSLPISPCGVIMTPTTQEWWSLGRIGPFSSQPSTGIPPTDEPDSDDSAPSSSSTDISPSPRAPHPASLRMPPTIHLASLSGPSLTSPTSLTADISTGLRPTEPEPTEARPTLTSVNGIIHTDGLPTLSAMSSHSLGSEPTSLLSAILDKPRPCSLTHDGSVRWPVDPRTYSAQTGQRSLSSFVLTGAAGAGAYGIVKHAREKGPDGQPVGPPLVIKYIVKQKILADCWKRHPVLGPIPVEIHVLDHLRRVSSRSSLVDVARTHIAARRLRGETCPIVRIPSRSAIQAASKDSPTGHPNICAILDYFEDPDYYYLVMPRFGAGKDLFELIEQSPDGLHSDMVRQIFEQIVDAVAFLHERNIVHRDLKDENVVLDESGNAQLIDFGSAAYVRQGKKFETFSGTLDFAPPEVLRGEQHGGKEIDVWALGVLMYVLINGECPFWNAEEAGRGIEPGSRARRVLEEKVCSGKLDRMSVDLMQLCLEVLPERRPGVEELCWHEYFVGPGGWCGERGRVVVCDGGN